MRTNEDRNWELIGSMLSAESSGKSPRLFSSRRTLFGIPSALDQEMAKLDEQMAKAPTKQGEAQAAPTAKKAAAVAAAPHCDGSSSIAAAPDTTSRSVASASCPAATSSQHGKAAPQRVVHPLDPVFDGRSRVLILGTMPSPKSRETGFYYNHPQNRFWKVLAALFDEPVPATNDEKRTLALVHGIALWDVLAECSIEGAADGTIAECVPNDIAWLLGKAPVEAVFCTGVKAAELYRKYCEHAAGLPCTRLPSTSPANASVSLAQLIDAYRQILPYCS